MLNRLKIYFLVIVEELNHQEQVYFPLIDFRNSYELWHDQPSFSHCKRLSNILIVWIQIKKLYISN